MAGVDLNAVGKVSQPLEYSYTWKDVVLYAVGIGAGNDDLDFVYEKKLKVYPTFATIIAQPALAWSLFEGKVDFTRLLHAEHKIVLHREIPREGRLFTKARIAKIYDKVKHALMIVEAETRTESGEHLFDNIAGFLIRGAGGFGGERGPKAGNEPPQREPDFVDQLTTWKDQNVIYRLSGDLNPLHIDPDFAKLAGFDKPILHGLCTFGFACRSTLRKLCGNDPSKIKSFEVRFSGVVFPGDTIVTEGWKADDEGKKYIIQSKNQHGNVVLSNGMVELR